MFSGREYAVFHNKVLHIKVQKGISSEKNQIFFVDVKKLRGIDGYVKLVFNTMKETEIKLYDRYYGSAYQNGDGVYAWRSGITEVIYSI
jgi:hypothetical protein